MIGFDLMRSPGWTTELDVCLLVCAGIGSSDDQPFAAHVTIAKMSKIRSKPKRGNPKLNKIPKVGSCLHSWLLQATRFLWFVCTCLVQ